MTRSKPWRQVVRQAARQAAAREDHLNAGFGYRWEHVKAVVATALRLAGLLAADRDVVEAAAWLHDVAKGHSDGTGQDSHGRAGAALARQILPGTDYPPDKIEAVAQAISQHIGLVSQEPVEPLEAAVIWDADKLTKLGALAVVHAVVLGLQEGTVQTSQDVAAWVTQLDLAERVAASMNTTPAQRAAQTRLRLSRQWLQGLDRELSAADLSAAGPPEFDPLARAGEYAVEALRQDGRAGLLWSPLWRLRVELTPCERALLGTWPLRRLHFVRHNGASALAYPLTTSRLQHTLGVLALVAHFHPDDLPLRAAALLHDVGHYPFCHSAELVPGVDHHVTTHRRVTSQPISGVLRAHGLNPDQVLALMDGHPPNPLRTHNGLVHLDHLDSWVRQAEAAGFGQLPAYQLLDRLRLEGNNVATDLATAEYLVWLISLGNQRHYAEGDVGPAAVLAHLLTLSLERGLLTADELADATDEALLARLALASDREMGELIALLRREPGRIQVRKLRAGEPPPDGALVAELGALYDAVPLVVGTGQPVTALSAWAADVMSQVGALVGTYAVTWTGSVPKPE